ncbi:MAG TPA: C25 family cysteine peptidase [Blastocatellia bacterium]|nr:C25 family cysteine peptidase [Blastocatellia bacterium]
MLRRFEAGGALVDLEADVVISRALFDNFILAKELTREQQEVFDRYSEFVSRRTTDIADLKTQLLNKRKAAAAVAPPRTAPLVPPSNDLCTGAEVINGAGPFPICSTVTADVTDATMTSDPPVPSCQTNLSRSIWYRFTPSVTATYTLTTCSNDGAATTVDDTVMAIYTSSNNACNGAFTEVPTAGQTDGCGDDECVNEALQARIETALTAGTQYFILIWEFDATAPTAGNTAVQLCISRLLPPSNDTCANATTLSLDTPLAGATFGAFDNYQLSGATCFTGISQTASNAPSIDVVYSFTAPVAGNYSFTVSNYNTESNLVIFAATTCPAATPGTPVIVGTCAAGANRHTTGSAEEIRCLALTANQTIFVFVDENVLSLGSAFTIEANLCVQESEANDTPATADTFICGVEGTLNPPGDADFYSLGTPASGSRVFALVNSVAANSTDLDLRVTTSTDTLEYDDFNNDGPFGSLGPNIGGTIANGSPVFLRVTQFGGVAAEPYRIYAAVQPPIASATAETEPNNTTGTASTAANLYFTGTLPAPAPSTDVDIFSFTASAGDLIFVSLDADPERNNTPINPALELLDSGGVVLVAVNDSGSTSNNTASPGTLTGTNPSAPSEGLVWRARVSGTYFVRVTIGTASTGTTGTGNYLLSISRNCAVGASTGITISGAVDYGITDCDPSTLEGRPVPGVTLTGIGALTRTTATGAPGTYSLTGLAKDSDYTVIPSKTGDVNGISTTDATRILQELTTPGTINSCQSQAGDATNNGSLSTTDATRVLQFLSGTPVAGNTTGTWKFIPASRSYTPLAVDQTNQNYEALLIGDVTGNWAPPAARSTQRANAPTGGIPVTIPDAAQDPGQMITIPILVPDLTGQGVEGFQFTLTFNPAILDFLNSDTTGTVSAGSLVSENEAPAGTVNLAAARATPFTGGGRLINLVFQVQPGAPLGGTTTLQFTQFNFGEGPAADFSDTGLFTVAQIPTAVKLSGFTATAYDGGVFLQWRTGFEASNLGFNIYRAEKRGLTRINPDILAGSALVTGAAPLTAGRSYDWFDNTAPSKRGTLYYIEDIDLNGTRTLHGPIAPVMVGGDPPARSRPALLSQLGKGSEPIISYPAHVSSSAAPARFNAPGMMAAGKAIPINTVDLAGSAAVKASVRERGWYRITQPQLLAAGLAAGTDPRLLQLYADGAEVPMRVLGEADGSFDASDAIEFFGVGLDNAVTDTRNYWVVAGNSAGQRIQQVSGSGGQPGDKSFRFTIERKDRSIYFSALRNGEVENFFGAIVGGSPVNQPLNLRNVDLTSSEDALLEISLQGVTTVAHRVSVTVNGMHAGEMEIMSQLSGFATFPIAHSLLREGSNDITLQSLNGASDLCLVDYIRLSYQHGFKADNDALQLTATGNELISIGGFTNDQIKVMDVTNPASVQELLGSVEHLKDGSYAITLSVPAGGQRTLFAFAANQAKPAAGLEANVPSSWRKFSNGADLLIITHTDFLGAAATLRAHRQRQGYAVAVINITDVYDEFSDGNKSPLAVREFISFARTTWKRAPRFLLFMGDASFDARNYLGLGNNDLVPTKLFDTFFMEAVSDDYFGDLNADGVPEIAIGRLPVRTPQDAANMVAKVIRYDQSGSFDEMLLVSDANEGYNFTAMSEALRPLVIDEVRINQLNRGDMDINSARAKLIDSFNRGQKIVNYTGHGSVDQWSGNLLTVTDGQGLENSDRLSIFIMMTCLNGYFSDANIDSLAESLLRPNGGAAAVWASTGMCLPEGQSLMNQEMYRQMFSFVNGKRLTLGEAAMRSKSSMTDMDVRRTWVLLGDPTTRLR